MGSGEGGYEPNVAEAVGVDPLDGLEEAQAGEDDLLGLVAQARGVGFAVVALEGRRGNGRAKVVVQTLVLAWAWRLHRRHREIALFGLHATTGGQLTNNHVMMAISL